MLQFAKGNFISPTGKVLSTEYHLLPELNDSIENVHAGPVEVLVDGAPRMLLDTVVNRLIEFNNDVTERARLQQDCAAFAFSCLKNVGLAGASYGTPAGLIIRTKYDIAWGDARPPEPQVEPGGVVITSSLPGDNPAFITAEGDVHFMVRASTDEKKTLYASKRGAQGNVFLHTFEGIQGIYPQYTAGAVRDMTVVK